MDPFSIIAGGANILGCGVSAYGQYKSAMANAALLDLQAKYLDTQAADMLVQGKAAEQDVIEQGRQLRETQKAGYAGQNVEVSSGSAIEVQEQTRDLAQQQADKTQLEYAREAWGLSTQATMTRKQAAVTRKTGRYQAMSTLLGGGISGGASIAKGII